MVRILVAIILLVILFFTLFPAEMQSKQKVLQFHFFLNQEDRIVFRELCSEYEKLTGVRIEMNSVPLGMFKEQLRFSARRNPPDLILIPNDWLGSFVESDMLQPLPKADLLERRFIDRCEDAVLIKDVCYGLPTLVETPVMICNTQLLPKPPTSFAALQSHCQLEYESGGTTSPFLFDIHSPYILSWFAGQRGSGFYPGHPVRTKENVLALELAAKMVRQASGNDDFSVDYPIFINRFQRGEVPLLLDGPWSFATLDRSNVPFEVYAPPCAPGSSGAFFSVKVLAITKNSTHPEEALKFARFLLTDDVMIRIAARGTMVPARLVPLVMLPTRTRAVLSALENAVLLPGQTNMDSFWQELSTFIHQQLHPQGEDSL